jgi:hypothetical protein
MIVWSHFLQRKRFRGGMQKLLPHTPSSPNAYLPEDVCVLLQRKLGQLERCELNTLRWRLFSRAAVWSRKGGKPTLKLAVRGEEARQWWRQILEKLKTLPNCNSVDSLQA